MKCPYCNDEMEKGLIQSNHEIAWLPGEKKKALTRADFYQGAVVLSELSFLKSSAVTAYICKKCEKVIIDFSDGNSDFNRR
ncbi:MAG: hypothetical protein H6Q59_3372 [Firmicutes bacterium]|nr:hypothetical protein [Bacillota bacterium]